MSQIGLAKSSLTSKGASGGGSSAFSALTSGSNTTATMNIGTGASLQPTGNGVVSANNFQGAAISAASPTNLKAFVWDGTNFVYALVQVPVVPAVSNLTAQAANVAATTILAVPASGQVAAGLYRLDVRIAVSRAASTSCVLPDTELIFTDSDTGATITVPITASNTINTTSNVVSGSYNFYAKVSTNIQIAIGQNTAYASVGATTMQFSYRARLSYLG